MKLLFTAMVAALMLTFATAADATTPSLTSQFQTAIRGLIVDLRTEGDTLKRAIATSNGQNRVRLRQEYQALVYRVQQMSSIERMVPRLSQSQLVCLAHHLNINISRSHPHR